MAYKEIIQRASKLRRRYDHIGWRGICTRCGLDRNILGKEVRELYADAYTDLRDKNIPCSSPRCTGRTKILYKMGEQRAVHLSDILRR